MLPGRHQFELVGDIGFHGFNPTPYFSRTHASHDFVRRGFERLSSRRLKSRVFSARLYKHSKSRSSFVYRSPLNPQQDPELPAQFHLVEHGLIPAPGHIFLSKAPRHLPEIVSAEERSRTWDVHQVNEAELIVLPMDWLSKKQSGRVVTTAIGLGMAPHRAPLRELVQWFLHGLVARQYALREVHSKDACLHDREAEDEQAVTLVVRAYRIFEPHQNQEQPAFAKRPSCSSAFPEIDSFATQTSPGSVPPRSAVARSCT